MYLWRAVDDEGEVLDMLVRKRRNKRAALSFLRKLLKRQGIHPETIVTDGLTSYGAQHASSAVPIVTAPAGCEKTIVPGIRICRTGAVRESSNGLNRKVPPRGFSPPTPLSTTPSTSSAIWSTSAHFVI